MRSTARAFEARQFLVPGASAIVYLWWFSGPITTTVVAIDLEHEILGPTVPRALLHLIYRILHYHRGSED